MGPPPLSWTALGRNHRSSEAPWRRWRAACDAGAELGRDKGVCPPRAIHWMKNRAEAVLFGELRYEI
eukprot:scaffold1428_cov259-Pinguiococcus_pyrenoidosus.AAC.14